MRSWGLAAAVSALLLAASASAVSGKGRTTVQLASAPPAGLVTGRPWTAVLVVKGGRPARVVLTATSGGRRVAATARRWRGNRYRARLVFRSAGRWALTARVGRVRFRLGAVRVRMQTPPPILFFYPTELGFDRSGALLVVENGRSRVLRIDPRSARVSTFVEAARPFGIAVAPSGDVYLSDSNTVLRIDAARRTTTVARADSDVGPLAVDSAGNVYFTTATRIFRIEGGPDRSPTTPARASRAAGATAGRPCRPSSGRRTGWRSAPTARSMSPTPGTTGSAESIRSRA